MYTLLLTLICLFLEVINTGLAFENMTHRCTLSTLYKSEDVRFAIFENLNQIFDIKFDDLLVETMKQSPYLVNPMTHFRRKLKRDFIEEGLSLETIEDVDLALKSYNYTRIKLFRDSKNQYDRNRNNG